MNKVKFFIITISALATITIANTGVSLKTKREVKQIKSIIAEQDNAINALKRYVDAQIYKKDAQLLLMNEFWGDAHIHEMLADSCENDCLIYKAKYNE